MATEVTPADRARAVRAAPRPEWSWPGLVVRIEWRLRLNSHGVWAASISEARRTPAGRDGKPAHLLTLVNDSLPVLIHEMADLFDHDGPAIANAIEEA